MNWHEGLRAALAAAITIGILALGVLVGIVFGSSWLLLSMPLAIILIVFLAVATAAQP